MSFNLPRYELVSGPLSRGLLTSMLAVLCLASVAFAQAPNPPTNVRLDAPSAFPDASNTGVPEGTILTNSGSITSSSDGQIIDARNITGTVTINHNNVTLKRSRVRGSGFWMVSIANGRTGAVIEDSEIDGMGTAGSGGGGVQGTVTMRRTEIKGVADGVVPGSNSVYEDNWIHALSGPGSPHCDTFQIQGGQSNVVIRHNTLDIGGAPGPNAEMYITTVFGNVNGITVDNNLMLGSPGYSVYSNQNPGYTTQNVRFTNNVIKRGLWGYIYPAQSPYYVKIAEWSNNVDYITNNVIPLQW